MRTVSQHSSKFEEEARELLVDPSIEISDSGPLRVNVTGGVHFITEKGLEALKGKEETTRDHQRAAQKKSSFLYFIEHAIVNDKTRDTQPGLLRLTKLKPKREI